MENSKSNYTPPLPSEPSPEKVILHLIREELKGHKFFEGLRELGLDDAFYQADHLEVIMAAVGIPLRSHESYDFYHQLFKKHSARVTPDDDLLLDEAWQVYHILQQHAHVANTERSTLRGSGQATHGQNPLSL